jgi:uncharacterized protein YdhG (YjbR/CyaY superfamily)
MPTNRPKRNSARTPNPVRRNKTDMFTAEELSAMKDLARERRDMARSADGPSALRTAIAAMPPSDRALAEWIHDIVTEVAPDLTPRTWYGMPAYAIDDRVICFFQGAYKFKTRYATLDFSDKAKLDDGRMWPTAFAIVEASPEVEARVKELVVKAIG